MTRSEFTRAFERALLALPCKSGKYLSEDERAAALRFYEEYLDDAGIAQEDPVPVELGDPAALARQIIAEAGEDAPQAAHERQAGDCPQFRSVHIEVANAGVEFLLGSEYHVQIDYPDGAPVPTVEMHGQTLFIEEKPPRSIFKRFSFRQWKGGMIRITVPQRPAAGFELFHIESVNGAIVLPALAVERVYCETVNGAVTLAGVTADSLHAESVNGAVSATGCYAHACAHCETVNGSLTLSGELRGETHCETVNGGIHVATALPVTEYTLDLETVSGSVYLDGEKHRKEVHIAHHAGNSIHAEAVNGSIRLEFCK